MSPLGPLPLLILQLAAILIITNLCGALCARLRQPRVVGEITGGLLLGPLALGHVFPSLSALVFPAARLQPLEIISNIGIVLFLAVHLTLVAIFPRTLVAMFANTASEPEEPAP